MDVACANGTLLGMRVFNAMQLRVSADHLLVAGGSDSVDGVDGVDGVLHDHYV